MKLEYILKRLPFCLIVWALGAATCGFAMMAMANQAATLNVETFSLVAMYLPYVAAIVCTLVTIIGSDQSFAALLWGMIFSVVVCMAMYYASQVILSDATVAQALLANSPEGTVIRGADSMRVGIRFLVSVLIPLIVAMVFSWAQKRRHPERYGKAKKNKSKMTKAEKREMRASK